MPGHKDRHQSLLTVSEGTAAKLPKLDSLKRTIQRQRVQQLAAPVQPTSLEQLALPPEYQQTAKGEQFLLYDSGPETQRILIFATQRDLEMLRLSDFWLADGTFKTEPPLFTQVYVVHALRGGPQPMRDGHLLPSLFVLPTQQDGGYLQEYVGADSYALSPSSAQRDALRLLTNPPILEWCDTILKNSTQCGRSGWLLGSSVTAH